MKTSKKYLLISLAVASIVVFAFSSLPEETASSNIITGTATFNAAHAPLYYPPSISNPNYQCNQDGQAGWGSSNGIYPVQVSTNTQFSVGDKLTITNTSGVICHRVHKPSSGDCKSCGCRNVPGICMDTNYNDDNRVYNNDSRIKIGFYSSNVASTSNTPIEERPLSDFLNKEVTIPQGTNYIFVYWKENKGDYFDNNVTFSMTLGYQIKPGCTPNHSKKCVGNAVYWFDSCNNQGTLFQQCTANQTCQNGQCVNVQAPTVTLSANPTILSGGQFGTISWTVANADKCYAISYRSLHSSPGWKSGAWLSDWTTASVNAPPSGNKQVLFPLETKGMDYLITLKCDGPGGSTYKDVKVTVNPPCTPNHSKKCVGNAVYWFDSCNNQGTLFQQCTANQTCQNGQCVNVSCNTNSDCGTDGYTGSTFCQSGNVYQNYTTYTCNNPGTANSSCSTSSVPQLKQTCGAGYTCQNGACVQLNDLVVSTYAAPNPADLNQVVTFVANATGGTGSYTYSWTGACSGVSSPVCTKSFSEPGTYSATVTVTSGTQTVPSVATVTVAQSCIPNHSKKCVGNAVYWFDSCNNQGTLFQQCTANQTCQNGQCVNVSCNTNSDCGTDGYTGSTFCQSGNVYQNYTTYTCNNPGTANSSCSTSSVPQLKQTCGAGYTCQNGACVQTQTNLNVSCYATPNPSDINQTVNFISTVSGGTGSYTYSWTGACTGSSSVCSNTYSQTGLKTATLTVTSGSQTNNTTCSVNINQACTQYSYQQCVGNWLYWYDSCGNQHGTGQYCEHGCSNNQCIGQTSGNVTINKTGRNLTTGSGFSTSVSASPSDMLMFMITLQNASNQSISNVFIKDIFPANLIYNGQLVVSGASYTGNFPSGITINTIPANQTVTITYQAQVASANNFSYGSTTLINNVSVTGSGLSYTPTGAASIVVTRSAVYGATVISTGLTNNPWVDSFLLPALVALLGIWMWKSGVFFGIEKWLDNKKKLRKGYKSEKELSSRISEIQKLERV
jgi:uncharacterized repeat protein (TIGR01451 family)